MIYHNRFRRLLEDFVDDQIRMETYKRRFTFNNHHSMSATSLSMSSSVGVELHCYLTTDLMLQIKCYPSKNYTANKVCIFVNFQSWRIEQFICTVV